MVIIPVRLEGDGFGETEYATVPLPVPLFTCVIVIQDALLVAVQEQLPWVVTPTLAVPPGLLKFTVVLDKE